MNLARENKADKLCWKGKVTGVQPRIRLLRSFDQRNHNYLGYVLRVNGSIGDEEREFLVGMGRSLVRCIKQGLLGKCPVEKVCPIQKRTGLMRMLHHIGGWMNEFGL